MIGTPPSSEPPIPVPLDLRVDSHQPVGLGPAGARELREPDTWSVDDVAPQWRGAVPPSVALILDEELDLGRAHGPASCACRSLNRRVGPLGQDRLRYCRSGERPCAHASRHPGATSIVVGTVPYLLLHGTTAKRCQVSGIPLSRWSPRSSKPIPEPATRSLTVPETRTSPGAASDERALLSCDESACGRPWRSTGASVRRASSRFDQTPDRRARRSRM
jgi:hypothetical protein